ncbi:MAG: molybdopterin molybdenumtransferase MoeA, partial [Candidatus Syntrophonatronum acetioxidans]
MVRVNEALSLILQNSIKTKVVNQDLEESSGRVLAENILADRDYPSFNRSRMDGFALSTSDLKNASPSNPVNLTIKGIIPAGSGEHLELKRGEAYKIMTGAPLPGGADGVVALEDCKWQADKAEFTRQIKAGTNIVFRGEEVKKGELILRKGMPVRSGEMVLLALAGKKKVKLYSPPRVGILVTGEEVVNI